MSRNAILGLGLLALVILGVLCIWTHAESILTAQGGLPPLVDLTADAGTIVARGVLPDDTTRMRFVNRAREVFGADIVVDRLRVADTVGVPHWMDEVLDIMPLLGSGVNNAGMRAAGDTLTLKGEVKSGEAKADILQKAAAIVNDGLVVKDRLVVVTRASKLARVQVNLDEELKGKTIEFASSSARITARGTAVLDRLIPIIRSVEDATIEISGHTDPTGERHSTVSSARRGRGRSWSTVWRRACPGNDSKRLATARKGLLPAMQRRGGDWRIVASNFTSYEERTS